MSEKREREREKEIPEARFQKLVYNDLLEMRRTCTRIQSIVETNARTLAYSVVELANAKKVAKQRR